MSVKRGMRSAGLVGPSEPAGCVSIVWHGLMMSLFAGYTREGSNPHDYRIHPIFPVASALDLHYGWQTDVNESKHFHHVKGLMVYNASSNNLWP
jgi:hypothetical protein